MLGLCLVVELLIIEIALFISKNVNFCDYKVSAVHCFPTKLSAALKKTAFLYYHHVVIAVII